MSAVEELRDMIVTSDNGGAIFSPCGTYRYALFREGLYRNVRIKLMTFIMLNPSTADAKNNDPTIRRCMAFAFRWGYHGMLVVNLFAYRSTDPKLMKAARCDVVGPRNDEFILAAAAASQLTVCAWGAHGEHMGRGARVASRLEHTPHVLGFTKRGQPLHPLYLSKTLEPQLWN